MRYLALLYLLIIPDLKAQDLSSGLDIGAECPAFDPVHVSGPDKNSTACPMCKYGSRQGVMVWVNDNDWAKLDPILLRLELEIKTRGVRQFRAFVMYMNPEGKSKQALIEECRHQAKRLGLHHLALTCVMSATDHETSALFNINPDKRVKNTVLVYSRRKVVYKVINLEASGLNDLLKSCDRQFAMNPL